MTLLNPRWFYAIAVVGNFLYLIGGQGPSGAQRSIERAAISGDGSLGAFTLAPDTLETARAGISSVVLGNKLYVFGGFGDDLKFHASVEVATLQ